VPRDESAQLPPGVAAGAKNPHRNFMHN
jgi:hypothetical protein